MIFFVKWNLLTGIAACAAFCIQKLFGKKLGHQWRKTVWMMLALRMCFPLELPMGTFWQCLFTISLSAHLPEKLAQGAKDGEKIQLAAQPQWLSGENRLLILWGIGFLLCFLLHAVQYMAWKKENCIMEDRNRKQCCAGGI